jgi:hypothetical protein
VTTKTSTLETVACGFRSGWPMFEMGPNSAIPVVSAARPLFPRKRTPIRDLAMSQKCRYCCKSPKLPGDNFPVVRRFDRRPPIYVVSITLPRSPVSLSSGDEVPHIFTRKSRLQPGEFLITSAERLLQQYLP